MNDRLEKIVIIAKYFIERYPEMTGQSQLEIECEGASPLSLIMDIECVDKMHKLALDGMLDDLDSFHVVLKTAVSYHITHFQGFCFF